MWGYIRNRSVTPEIATRPILLCAGLGFVIATGAAKTAVPIGYAAAILIGMAVVTGPVPIAIGGALGILIHDLFYGAAGYWTLVTSAWIVTYAGGVAWLSLESRVSIGSRQRRTVRSTLIHVGTIVIAGVYATGLAAWLATALNGNPVYIATAALLPGVAVATGVGVILLLAFHGWNGIQFGNANRSRNGNRPETDGGTQLRAEPKMGTAVGLFVIGAAWLGGATVLDIVVRDLGLFVSENQLTEYVTGIVGGDSLISTAMVATFVSIYRYGDLAVLLSAPIAVVAVIWYANYRSTGTLIGQEKFDG